jgi:hypothetical protein
MFVRFEDLWRYGDIVGKHRMRGFASSFTFEDGDAGAIDDLSAINIIRCDWAVSD